MKNLLKKQIEEIIDDEEAEITDEIVEGYKLFSEKEKLSFPAVKKSKSEKEAFEKLKKIGFTDNQINHLLECRLSHLRKIINLINKSKLSVN